MDQPWWGSGETLALTISEAARVCGIRRRAIRRRHQAGEFVHSFKDADGTWRIPLSDLMEAGLEPHVASDPDEPRIVSAATSHIERLRTEVAVLRERVRALEIIAREREERVEDLRTILRMLPAPREIDELPAPGLEEVSLPRIDRAATPQIDEAAPPGLEEPTRAEPAESEATPADVHAFPREFEEEVIPADDQEVGVASQPSSQVPSGVRPQETASPFDAPAWAGAPTATAWRESAAGTAPSGGADRAAPPAPPTEPLVVLPDAVGAESIRPEETRQRPAELLEDAMSLWWPAPPSRAQPEGPSPAAPDAPDEWRDAASEAARRQEELSDEGASGSGVTDQKEAATDVDPFSNETYEESPYDEASYDWMDPGFGRPPRHRRRRLGRFFRRSRRPQ